MSQERLKLRRERKTIQAMIEVYCRDLHAPGDGSCPECLELATYAARRLEKCPFHENKPPCAKCPIHCYQPARRQQIQAVMRYSGPRMMLRHPISALKHWLDGFKKVPPKPKRGNRTPVPVPATPREDPKEGKPDLTQS